jgi:hypothetical protein
MRIEPAKAFHAPLRQRRGPAERLRAAIAVMTSGEAQVVSHQQASWASITFSGTRHSLELLFEGAAAVEAAERFVGDLPEHEFTVPGHIVADATVRSVVHTLLPEPRMEVGVELLLLEDG